MQEVHIDIDYCTICGANIAKGKKTVEVGICQDCYNRKPSEGKE